MVRKQILGNIDYENLLTVLPDDAALLDELVDIMAEVMLTQDNYGARVYTEVPHGKPQDTTAAGRLSKTCKE